MNSHARFWAADLHTHTPASRDVDVTRFGGSTPNEIVEAALDAGLDAIAITDHNTTDWCDRVAEAARSTALIVLPGVEVSTTEGHLLGVWEEGTPATKINEVLVKLGIGEDDRGRLDIVAEVGFAATAKEIAVAGGLAIAAHVDRPRGLLQLPVAGNIKRILCDPNLAAVEVVDLDAITTVRNKIGGVRKLAYVRGSDSTKSGSSQHVLAGVGSRRTWVKASRPDLVGIRHALDDFDLRVRLEEPASVVGHPHIIEVSLTGGFFEEAISLSPDLNCLLGGTGAGKSLVLEAIRYATGQQVSQSAFPTIWEEVRSRLTATMGSTGSVRVLFLLDGDTYAVERPVAEMDSMPVVHQLVGGDWMEIDLAPNDLLRIDAFSQGEALEFSRQPVGRMQLVDSGLDLEGYEHREAELVEELRINGEELLEQREYVAGLEGKVAEEARTKARADDLAKLFVEDRVAEQESWATEKSALDTAVTNLPGVGSMRVRFPSADVGHEVAENADLFEKAASIIEELRVDVTTHVEAIDTSIRRATGELQKFQEAWRARHDTFKKHLADELSQLGDDLSLVALQSELGRLQGRLAEIRQLKTSLVETEEPALRSLVQIREDLLSELHGLRAERRDARRRRVDELNSKTAGIVKLDVPAETDRTAFRQALESLKVGSRVRETSLDAMADEVHPFELVRQLMNGTPSELVKEDSGFDEADVGRLLANIDDRELWSKMMETQTCPLPDRLNVKFKKPETQSYEVIEKLAPGQRCTAVLVVLLADGNAPVIVDQPEDALHAPWIEEYIVERLRGLRGVRQYIFATRSPGIVVGADAEQIVTMKATSGRGTIEAIGSLERHDLNMLALHHLEGGPEAYRRRNSKLDISMNQSQ